MENKASPRCLYNFIPRHCDDTCDLWITTVIAADDTRLVMADYHNSNVKVIDLKKLHGTDSECVDEKDKESGKCDRQYIRTDTGVEQSDTEEFLLLDGQAEGQNGAELRNRPFGFASPSAQLRGGQREPNMVKNGMGLVDNDPDDENVDIVTATENNKLEETDNPDAECNKSFTNCNGTDSETQDQKTERGKPETILNKDQNSLKSTDILPTSFDAVSAVQLENKPWRLALLDDGKVAATSNEKCLYFIDVAGKPFVESHVHTERHYKGVCRGIEIDTLIVSCVKDADGPARIDVVAYDGVRLQTVADCTELWDLSEPAYMYLHGQDLFISDSGSGQIYNVNLELTGEIILRGKHGEAVYGSPQLSPFFHVLECNIYRRLAHDDLHKPRQIAVDANGKIYVACSWSRCIMSVEETGTGNRWRRLVKQHAGRTCDMAYGVCLMGSRLIVAWRDRSDHKCNSTVAVYELV